MDDVLDEVLQRAWQRFASRPRHLPLDQWLTDLLHETLKQWIKQEPRPHVSLEEKAEAGRSRPLAIMVGTAVVPTSWGYRPPQAGRPGSALGHPKSVRFSIAEWRTDEIPELY